MTKRNELVPLFTQWEKAVYNDLPCTILSVSTYCVCCDRFLDEVHYAIKMENSVVHYKIPESKLSFPQEKSSA